MTYQTVMHRMGMRAREYLRRGGPRSLEGRTGQARVLGSRLVWLPPPGGAPPRRRRLLPLVVALCVPLCACTSGSSSAGKPGAGHSDSQSGLEQAAIGNFMPATYQDLRSAIPLQVFFGAVNAQAITQCLHDNGFDLTYPQPHPTFDYSDANSLFPDLKDIATQGILPISDLRGEPAWHPDIPASQKVAFQAVLRRCALQTGDMERTAVSRWTQLQTEWANVDAKGDSDATYLRLVRRFAQCVSQRGYSGSTPTAFLEGVDRLIQASFRSHQPEDKQLEISHQAGRVYAKCYSDANARRQAVRLKARAQFMDEHALEIADAQAQLERRIVEIGRQVGVRYVPSTP